MLGKGDLPGLMENLVERRHRFWSMDFVLVPELLILPFSPLLGEETVRRIHFLPTFQLGRYLDFPGIREPSFFGHGLPPFAFNRVLVSFAVQGKRSIDTFFLAHHLLPLSSSHFT
jgi:hypothetical protein